MSEQPNAQSIKRAEKQYFANNSISSSGLKEYWNGGNYSGDKYLEYLRRTQKYGYDCELGKIWELLIQDALGYEEKDIRSGKGLFGQAYFVHECPNKPNASGEEPEEDTEENGNGNGNGKSSTIDQIIWCIYEGNPLPAISMTKGKKNKAGEWTEEPRENKSAFKKNALIRDCNDHPGMIPVYKRDFDMLLKLAQRLMKTEIILPSGVHVRVDSLLTEDSVEWQKQIFWDVTDHETGITIKKKAMVDCLVLIGGQYVALDFKCYAEIAKFVRKLRNEGAWIQAVHYLEGLRQNSGQYPVCDQFYFLVGEKKSPYLCEPVVIDPDSLQIATLKYQDMCRSFGLWDAAGRPETGTLKQQSVRLWLP